MSILEMSIDELLDKYSEPTSVVEVNVVLRPEWIENGEEDRIKLISEKVDQWIELRAELENLTMRSYGIDGKDYSLQISDIFVTAKEILFTLESIEDFVRIATNGFKKVPNENLIMFSTFITREKERIFDELKMIFNAKCSSLSKRIDELEEEISMLVKK